MNRIRQAAFHEALKSDIHIQHGAIITKGSKIVIRGFNKVRTSFLNKKRLCVHAEMYVTQQLIKTQFHRNSMKPDKKFSKYIIWVIPSIGFMGTVYGIGLAVSQLGAGSLDDPQLLIKMAGSLGIAFNTTLVALVLSVILQFLTQHYEAKEEKVLNNFSKYIMDNLINKLVEKR